MNKAMKALSVAVVGSAVMASTAMAQVFPPTAAQTTSLANVSADIVLWGALLIGVALTILAYRRITRIVK